MISVWKRSADVTYELPAQQIIEVSNLSNIGAIENITTKIYFAAFDLLFPRYLDNHNPPDELGTYLLTPFYGNELIR